jgi:hypothetical protein
MISDSINLHATGNNFHENHFMNTLDSQNMRSNRASNGAPAYTIAQTDFLSSPKKITTALENSWLYSEHPLVTYDQFVSEYVNTSTRLEAGSKSFNEHMKNVAVTLKHEADHAPLFDRYVRSTGEDPTPKKIEAVKTEDEQGNLAILELLNKEVADLI